MSTPIRSILLEQSSLLNQVANGLAAVSAQHRASLIDDQVRGSFEDSLDLDAALVQGNEQANRWDYLLGHRPSRKVVGLEPHTANNHEVKVVVQKRAAALVQLRPHLKQGATIASWLWVASGPVDFLPHEKAILVLSQQGVTFVGRRLLSKHLPSPVASASQRRAPARRIKKRAK